MDNLRLLFAYHRTMGGPSASRLRRQDAGKLCQNCMGVTSGRGYLRLCRRCLEEYEQEAVYITVRWHGGGWQTAFVREWREEPVGRVRSYNTHHIPLAMVRRTAAHPWEIAQFEASLNAHACASALLLLSPEQIRKLG